MLKKKDQANRKAEKHGGRRRIVHIAAPVALALTALFSLLVFQSRSIRRTQEQVFEALQDSAAEQARALSICIDGRFEALETYAGTLDPARLGTTETQLKSMGRIILATDFSRLCFINHMGDAFTSQGLHVNVKSQTFFRRAMAGETTIAKNEGDGVDPVAHFVLAVPLRSHGRVVGVVAGTYSEQAFRNLMMTEAFDELGHSVVCDRHGKIIIGGNSETYPKNNIFSMLERARLTHGTLNGCRSDFASGAPGVIGIRMDGGDRYGAYMPIGVNDWMIFNDVPGHVVNSEVNRAVWSGVKLTGVIMLIALTFIVYIFISDQKQRERLNEDRRLLRLSEERYRIALAETAVAIWEYDFQTRSVIASEKADESNLFYRERINVPDSLVESGYIHENSSEAFLAMYERLFAGEKHAEGMFRVRDSLEGRWYYVHIRYTNLFDEAGKPYRAVGIAEDVTERQQAKLAYERELQVQQAMDPDMLLTALFDATNGETIRKWFRDEREAVSLHDDRLETFTRYAADHIVDDGEKPADWEPTITTEILLKRFADGQTEMVFEYLRRMPDGTERWVADESHLMIDPDSGHLMMFTCLRDVDGEHRKRDALLQAAAMDRMTGLLNHEAALKRIQEELAVQPDNVMHALFMIDIDNFKTVNDTYGHQAGDIAIKQMALLVRGAFRESDVVGRIGGDEFIVLMKNAGGLPAVRRKAQELTETLQCCCRSGEHMMELSASIGVCVCKDGCRSLDALYHDADAALYESKSAGKNRYTLHSQGMRESGEPQNIAGVSSNVQFRTLLANMDGGVAMAEVTDSVRIVYTSPSLYRMMGLEGDAGDATEENVLSYIVPEDRPGFETAVFDAAREEKRLAHTYRVQTNGGRMAWHHVSGACLPAQPDGVCRIISLITDVTEQKRSEERLRAEWKSVEQDSLGLFQLNLTKNTCAAGDFLFEGVRSLLGDGTVDGFYTRVYERIPDPQELVAFCERFSRERLLRQFAEGLTIVSLDHMFLVTPERNEWVRTTVYMTHNSETGDVEAVTAARSIHAERTLQATLERLVDVEYEYIALIDRQTSIITLVSANVDAPAFAPVDDSRYETLYTRTVEECIVESEREDGRISFSLPIVVDALRTLDVYTRIYAVNDAASATRRKKWQYTYLDDSKRTIVLTMSDVTDTFLAEVDPVTGIFNRYKLAEQVRATLSEHPETKFALVRMDIDNFKVFNDVYGVDAGDRLLKSAADYLRSLYYRYPMMLYGHIEADHFACCLPVSALEKAPKVSEITGWLRARNPEFAYSPRIGVYRIDEPGIDISLMSDRAYLALKSIKGRYDRHVAYYNESMRKKLLNEQEIVGQMHGALASGQFDIYLQPQYDYATGEMTGAEALARWRHPEKGVLAPGDFIPVFEQNGFVTQLDKYIWERACMLLAKWKASGEPLVPLSVNVSRVDIYDQGILKFLQELMQKYDLAPALLRLEITESAYMETPRQLISVVEKLRAAGFAVEMDDFGSGYSSLNMLSDVQVDTLKLDMHFLANESRSANGNNVLNSIVRLTRWLRLPVIAEGVETREQADYLKSIGCVRMQGYHFGRPMPVETFERIKSNARIAPAERPVRLDAEREAAYRQASALAAKMFADVKQGALIVEHCGDNIEALRINDRFYEISGLKNDVLTPWALHMQAYLPEEARQSAMRMLEEAVQTEGEACCEITCMTGDAARRFRCLARLVTRQEDRSILFVSVERAE